MWQTGPPVNSTPLLISPMKYHTLYGKELFKISDHLLIFESIECSIQISIKIEEVRYGVMDLPQS